MNVDPRLLASFVLVGVVSVGAVAGALGGVGAGIFGAALALVGGGGAAWPVRPRERGLRCRTPWVRALRSPAEGLCIEPNERQREGWRLVRSRVEARLSGAEAVAAGVLLLILMPAIDPEPMAGAIAFARGSAAFAAVAFFSLRSRFKRQIGAATTVATINGDSSLTRARVFRGVLFWTVARRAVVDPVLARSSRRGHHPRPHGTH
jgi:hypothetical protein